MIEMIANMELSSNFDKSMFMETQIQTYVR